VLEYEELVLVDDDELVSELLEDTTDEASLLSTVALASAACWASAIMIFGAFFKKSRRPSVRGPRPMDVKKLMAYRVFRTLSLGNKCWNASARTGSSVSKRFFRLAIPIASAISCTRIFKKMREDDVVSSSFK
jgi:hypothetical protein